MDELHLQSGVFVRYDEPNSKFAVEFDKMKPHNLIYYFVNSIAKVTDEILPTNTFLEDGEMAGFTPWPSDRQVDSTGLPMCIHTHSKDREAEMAHYK